MWKHCYLAAWWSILSNCTANKIHMTRYCLNITRAVYSSEHHSKREETKGDVRFYCKKAMAHGESRFFGICFILTGNCKGQYLNPDNIWKLLVQIHLVTYAHFLGWTTESLFFSLEGQDVWTTFWFSYWLKIYSSTNLWRLYFYRNGRLVHSWPLLNGGSEPFHCDRQDMADNAPHLPHPARGLGGGRRVQRRAVKVHLQHPPAWMQ